MTGDRSAGQITVLPPMPAGPCRRCLLGMTLSCSISGTGPGVVLVHGTGGDATNWGPVPGLLAARHTVVSVDALADVLLRFLAGEAHERWPSDAATSVTAA